MKLAILGGAGFVGGNLARWFRERGHAVTVLDNLSRRGSDLNVPELERLGARFVRGDVTRVDDLRAIPKDTDALCLCAGQTSIDVSYREPVFDFTVNTLGALHCLEWCRQNGAGLIFCSTNKVYDAEKLNAIPRKETDTRWIWHVPPEPRALPPGFDPADGISTDFSTDGGGHTIYGVSKICADLLCQEWAGAYGVRTIVNRFSCLAGEWQFGTAEQGWVAWLAAAALFDLPVTWIGWKGKQVRDVLFVEDLCRLVELEAEAMDRLAGQVFNIGGGKENTLSLVEAGRRLERAVGKPLSIRIDPEPRKSDQCIYISDIRKAERLLSWTPKISIEAGYERLLRWMTDHRDKLRPIYR